MSQKISHSGIVERIDDGCVHVRIVQTSACAACKVAGYCNAAESKEKIIDVYCDSVAAYQVGQQVVVGSSEGAVVGLRRAFCLADDRIGLGLAADG